MSRLFANRSGARRGSRRGGLAVAPRVGPIFALLLALGGLPGFAACREGRVPAPVEAPGPPTGQNPNEAGSRAGDGVASPAGPRPRALWVLCEGSRRVLEDADAVPRLVQDARALGASDLFVQVYRGGRAWYDSSLADPAPYQRMLEKTGGDSLAALIAEAHTAGLRVHAWVNVLSLSANPGAPIVRDLGRDAVLVDRQGRSLLDYPDHEVPQPDREWYRMGTRGVYLDPAAPGVAERLSATFVELVTRYPGLDGLHLDYIRHPGVLPFIPGSRFGVGLDFGYGSPSRLQFQRDTGLKAPTGQNMVNTRRWDTWRRDQVTGLVARIAAESRAARPGLTLSAAVIPHVDRAYLSLFQDWKYWLEEGLIDLAVPMVYTLDDRHLRHQVAAFAGAPHGERIWPGLGTWLFARSPGRALAQLALVREAGAAGDALFSYDAIADAPELLASLASPSKREGDSSEPASAAAPAP